MNILNHLIDLDRAIGAGCCPSCGLPPEGQPMPAGVEFIVREPGDADPGPCVKCGRRPPRFTLPIGPLAGAHE